MSAAPTPDRMSPRRRLLVSLAAALLVVVGLPWALALSGPGGAPAPPLADAPSAPTPSEVPAPAAAAPASDGARVLGDDDLFGDGAPDPADDGASSVEAIIEGATRPDPAPGAPTAAEPTPGGPAVTPGALIRAALGSLLVGLLTALVATLVGGLLGLTSGYRGGLVERIAVRWFADGLDALPQFVVLVTAVALYRDLAGTEGDALLVAVGVLIGLVNSTQVLLVVHHQTRLIAGRKYVIAARLMGWSALRVVRHKIVPHVRHELIIPFTQLVIWGVFVETALSYLGFGPSSTGSTLGAQLRRIDPFARSEDLAPAIVMCLMTVALAAALRAMGDALDALYAGPPTREEPS